MKHANLKALFTAIANSIRNKTGGTDAIIADDFPEAIDGIQTGGGVDKIQRYIELNGNSAQYMFYRFNGTSVDELMDGVATSNVTDMSYMFQSCANLTTVPLFDTSNVESVNNMFQGCKSLINVPLLDLCNITSLYYTFYSCESLSSIPLFDTSKVSMVAAAFTSCKSLTAIPALDMRNVTTFSDAFSMCAKLTDIWIRNIKANLVVTKGSYGHPTPTLESLLHLCKECRNTGSQNTLTISTGNINKLAKVYVKLIPITDDMRAEDDLIDEKYPFVQCESTDDGAMTIQDYMALKMWSLA